ncbi:Glycosyltransferase [Caenispirillum salinarum AK4]|uniref:Glycosyltransferase n=1 Tax=Caenispirillum salinarum AK4 TaxID=1238182 RepID=K9H5I8_9PROT|nr:glycosyltransferase family 2 protein [Caenispirillum salinarum]EKV25908.1 Glycosyltransferase [Caenispirillum salinarum AK4]
MNTQPLVSIVTVSFNSAATIGRTIDSVRAQTYPNIEFIVIDGGSTDGTVDIIRDNADVISRWVSEPDAGIYDAMNKGVRQATGDWIHILNSDDFYADPDVLERAVPLLDPQRTNYFAMWREFDDGRRDLQNWAYSRWRLFVSAFLPHPGLIVSREQYEAAGLYDCQYRVAADHDMILRLTRRWPGLGHPVPLTVMAQGGFSEQNMLRSLREFQRMTIAHGLSSPLAQAVYWFKRVWWRV